MPLRSTGGTNKGRGVWTDKHKVAPRTEDVNTSSSAGRPSCLVSLPTSADELEAEAHEKIAEGHALLARARRMRTAPAAETWLTLEAAGQIANVRARVIRDAGRRGELVIDHAGRSPRVTRAEIDRWLASRRARVASAEMTPREAARAAVAARAQRSA